MVALIAAPAMAEVLVTADVNNDDLTVTLSYDVTSMSPNLPRAFALDIVVDSGAVITDVTEINPNFNIYPGSIVINPVTGIVENYGSAVCDPCEYDGTLGGLDTNGVTIEMGSLETTPGSTGVICKITVDAACCGIVTENVIRGGAVMEDPDLDSDANLPGFCFGCACMGDVSSDYFGTPGEDGLVNLGDLNKIMMDMMMAYPTGDGTYMFIVPYAGRECFDMSSDAFGTPGQNQQIDLGDLNYLMMQMMMAYPTGDGTYIFEVGCQ